MGSALYLSWLWSPTGERSPVERIYPRPIRSRGHVPAAAIAGPIPIPIPIPIPVPRDMPFTTMPRTRASRFSS